MLASILALMVVRKTLISSVAFTIYVRINTGIKNQVAEERWRLDQYKSVSTSFSADGEVLRVQTNTPVIYLTIGIV